MFLIKKNATNLNKAPLHTNTTSRQSHAITQPREQNSSSLLRLGWKHHRLSSQRRCRALRTLKCVGCIWCYSGNGGNGQGRITWRWRDGACGEATGGEAEEAGLTCEYARGEQHGVCDGKDKAFSVVQRSDYLCVSLVWWKSLSFRSPRFDWIGRFVSTMWWILNTEKIPENQSCVLGHFVECGVFELIMKNYSDQRRMQMPPSRMDGRWCQVFI